MTIKYIEYFDKVRDEGLEEIKSLIQSGFKHNLTIGEMCEGIVKEIISFQIEGVDLRSVKGFIKNSKGQLSKEIDCMLVLGEGQKLPKIDKYIYDIDKVVAVIEVKKRIRTRDIEKGFKNLQSIYNISDINDSLEWDLFEDCYEGIVG